MTNLAVSGTIIKWPTWAICMWLTDNSQDTGGKEELLEEKKGFVYVSQQTCQRLQEKTSTESRRQTQKTATGTCIWKKGTMKAWNEKTETDKISEGRKNLQPELVTLESRDMRLVCHLYAAICFSADVHVTLGKVVSTSIVTTIICDVMPVAPAPGFSEFFALWLSQAQEYCLI